MMIQKYVLVVLVLGSLQAISPAGAQLNRDLTVEEMHSEARVALVIGNGAYDDAPLKNPPNDARSMARTLEGMGFEVIEKVDIGYRDLYQAIRDFGRRIRGGGVGLFYYAGHGIQIKGRNYLLPVDADIASEDEVPFQAIDAGLVLGKMESAENRVNIVILDACRNNPFARSFRSASRGLANMEAATGSFVAYATAPGQVAADGEGDNGLYTQMLLEHIQRPGIAIEQVFKDVRRDVMRHSGDKQVPWDTSSLTGQFYFSMPAAAPPPKGVAFGHLQVNVNAPGSQVYVDGIHRGGAQPGQPLNMRDVATGPIQVRVVAPGFGPQEKTHTLTPGQWTQAVVELKPDTTAGPGRGHLAILSMSLQGKKNDTMDRFSLTLNDTMKIKRPGKSSKARPQEGYMGILLKDLPEGNHKLKLEVESIGFNVKEETRITILPDKVLFIRMDWRVTGLELDEVRHLEPHEWQQQYADDPAYEGEIFTVEAALPPTK